MENKKFAELLEVLGKDKKAEDEAVLKIPSPEIKAHKADPKTYFDKWKAARDESEKL